MPETREQFNAGVKQWMDQFEAEDKRKAKLKSYIGALGKWYGLVCGLSGLFWLFWGLPEWHLSFDPMGTVNSNWFFRLAYIAVGWPIVAFIGWAILLIPLSLLGMAWVIAGRVGLPK